MIENCKVGDTVWYSSVRLHSKTGEWIVLVKELLVEKIYPNYLNTGLAIGARQKHLDHGLAYRPERLHPTRKNAVKAVRATINAHIADLEVLRSQLLNDPKNA